MSPAEDQQTTPATPELRTFTLPAVTITECARSRVYLVVDQWEVRVGGEYVGMVFADYGLPPWHGRNFHAVRCRADRKPAVSEFFGSQVEAIWFVAGGDQS